MALGGGTFVTQNKVLPGTYINFVSAASASATLSDRGYAAMPLELDWGPDDTVFEVTNGDFQKKSPEIFGYDYTHSKLKGLRDLFANARVLYAYKLTSDGVKASNDYAEALYCGTRGNAIKISIQKNADDESAYDVKTIIDTTTVDVQTVKAMTELVPNKFVKWKTDATLEEKSGEALSGGTNGGVTGTSYQKFLEFYFY